MMENAMDNMVPGAIGSGRAWTVLEGGAIQHLEMASLRAVGDVRGDCSSVEVGPVPHPITLICALSPPGVPAMQVQHALDARDWVSLRAATRVAGALDLMLAPAIIARYRAQAWINDRALDVEDSCEDFDVLPGIMATYPTIEEFLQQAGHNEWDDLACFSVSGQIHLGPYEVEVDHELVLILAALYKGDSQLVADLIAGDPVAAARVTQEDWDRMRSFVAVLSPKPVHVPADTPESLLFASLAAWEGEEDSVQEEHADLIARMRVVAHRLRPHAVAAPKEEAGEPAAPMRMRG